MPTCAWTNDAGGADLEALSEPEVLGLANVSLDLFGAYGPTFRACVLFAAYVGLRPGEMFVLQWSDIDLASGRVQINRSLGNTGEVTLPKNGLRRCVVLPPQAREVLLAMPRRANSPCSVFTAPRGARFSKTSHSAYHRRMLRSHAGRADMAFYELRHFCATHLLELGVSHADVAVQLGHTDGGALVMSTYGHPSEDAQCSCGLTPPTLRLRSRCAWSGPSSGGSSSLVGCGAIPGMRVHRCGCFGLVSSCCGYRSTNMVMNR